VAIADIDVRRGRKSRISATPFAIIVLLALVTALFVFPIRSFVNQRTQLAQRQAEYAVFEDDIENVQDQVTYLQTEAGLQDAIRNQLGYVRYNERRLPMMDLPALSTELPDPLALHHRVHHHVGTQSRGCSACCAGRNLPATLHALTCC